MMHRMRAATSLCASLQRALPHASVLALPQPASAVAAAPAAASVRTLFTPRSALLAPREKKGGRGSAADDDVADDDAPTATPTLDSAAAAAAAPAEPAPRAKKVRAAKPEESLETINKKKLAMRGGKGKLRKDGTLITRKDMASVASVIEKEVPLMDLTGLTPGQNKYADILQLMREQSFPEDVIADLEQVGDLATGSTAEILSGRLYNLRQKYGRMPHDTGSPEVQVAMLTERIKGYDRHQMVHRSDIANRRGFLKLWHRRRKLLKYLRRTRYETYAYMMRELQLNESEIDTYGLDRKSATQAPRIKRD